jgi:4-hydroxybenzoate polyprenyltransferase
MKSVPPLRTLLVLGRVADWPTVWSSALAGWWLGGGGNFWKLPFLLLGASALYAGGAFLNDAFDAETDRTRHPNRPIPAGKIAVAQVWRWGFGVLGVGLVLLLICSKIAALAALLLAVTAVAYNFAHQFFTASPWLLGACRFWLYVAAAATGAWGLDGWAIFSGAALLCYVAGADFLVRRKKAFRLKEPWLLLLLAAPIFLALLLNTGDYRRDALAIGFVLFLWLARCLRNVFTGGEIHYAWLAGNLLAGVVVVDWLAVAPQIAHVTSTLVFVSLFGLTKWLQKIAPAS